MDFLFEPVSVTFSGDMRSSLEKGRPAAHDIPHPIGDPDDDEGLPGDDEDEEDDDDEEPLQARHRFPAFLQCNTLSFFSAIIKPLRRSASEDSAHHSRLPAA
jgi:hypothetical protein